MSEYTELLDQVKNRISDLEKENERLREEGEKALKVDISKMETVGWRSTLNRQKVGRNGKVAECNKL